MRFPVHLSVGQEAPAVGVCNALTKGDFASSTHRCHAHFLAKGGNLKAMLSELYGKETGCCEGKGGSMHLNDSAYNATAGTSTDLFSLGRIQLSTTTEKFMQLF